MYTKYTLLMKSTKPDYKMVSNGTFIQDEILFPTHSIHVFLLGTEFWQENKQIFNDFLLNMVVIQSR